MANILPDKPSTTPTTHYKAGIPIFTTTTEFAKIPRPICMKVKSLPRKMPLICQNI